MADTTITDKKAFSCNVVDKEKYSKLSQDEKTLFEILRNSLLEIFPVEPSNTYSDATIKFAENFAFIAYKGLSKTMDDKIEKALIDMKMEIQTIIMSSNNTGGTSGTT